MSVYHVTYEVRRVKSIADSPSNAAQSVQACLPENAIVTSVDGNKIIGQCAICQTYLFNNEQHDKFDQAKSPNIHLCVGCGDNIEAHIRNQVSVRGTAKIILTEMRKRPVTSFWQILGALTREGDFSSYGDQRKHAASVAITWMLKTGQILQTDNGEYTFPPPITNYDI